MAFCRNCSISWTSVRRNGWFFFHFLTFQNFVWENKFYCTKIINKSQLTCRCNGKLPLMHRCTHSCSRSHLAMSGPECKFVLCRCSYLLKNFFKSINILLYESGITQNVFSNKKKKVHFNLKKKLPVLNYF